MRGSRVPIPNGPPLKHKSVPNPETQHEVQVVHALSGANPETPHDDNSSPEDEATRACGTTMTVWRPPRPTGQHVAQMVGKFERRATGSRVETDDSQQSTEVSGQRSSRDQLYMNPRDHPYYKQHGRFENTKKSSER